jgi:hypothetical protein
MSYESKMLQSLAMPSRNEVEKSLLRALLRHGGVIEEFGSGEYLVDEIAEEHRLIPKARTTRVSGSLLCLKSRRLDQRKQRSRLRLLQK